MLRPGIGVVLLHTLAEYGLAPLLVVTPRRLGGPLRGSGANTAVYARKQGWPRKGVRWLERADTPAALAALELDYIATFGFGLLGRPIFSAARHGTVNFHPSLLPAHRGPSPVHRALDAGERRTGYSLMRVDEGIDTGPVLHQCAVDIAPGESADILMQRLCILGARALVRRLLAAELLGRGLAELSPDSLVPTAEASDCGASYESRLRDGELTIDGAMSAVEVARRIQACRDRGGARYAAPWGELRVVDCARVDGAAEKKTSHGHQVIRTADDAMLLLIGRQR